ncbi:hypothetical protein BG015_008635 [Linnemannia schmuckeri]|uniref:Uncharacterized protein n=1 Tax=Linnemannia schmuckeri TaxID=64567 RepID=A0A9P5VA61_9FUNG|nr:hypothetical protein BG015_008635 [Linnemannia schmuckeri]
MESPTWMDSNKEEEEGEGYGILLNGMSSISFLVFTVPVKGSKKEVQGSAAGLSGPGMDSRKPMMRRVMDRELSLGGGKVMSTTGVEEGALLAIDMDAADEDCEENYCG